MSSPTQLLLCDCVTIVLVAVRVHLCDSRRFRVHTSTALWQVLVFTQIVEVHSFVTPTVLVFTQIQFCESTCMSTQVQLCDTDTNDSPRFQWHEHSFVTVLVCLGTEFCDTYKVHKCSFETVLVLYTSTDSFATVLVCTQVQAVLWQS